MPPQPLPPAGRARLLQIAVGTGVVFEVLAQVAGPSIAEHLQGTPVTFEGWIVAGWIVGGPAYLVAMLLWIDGGRLSLRRRRQVVIVVGVGIGLGMFILPAAVPGPGSAFGTGGIVGGPLTQGWLWGVATTLVMALYGSAVMVVLGRAPSSATTPRHRELTARYIEVAWVVVLSLTLVAALSGATSGVLREYLNSAPAASVEIPVAV